MVKKIKLGGWGYIPPSNDWIERRIDRTSYDADHFSFKMSRQMLPWRSTFGWKHGVTNLTVGALYG